MTITLRVLAMGKKPLRRDQRQTVLGPGHGDIEQPAFLLDFMPRAGSEIGGHAAIDHIEHEDGTPFLALGRMDGGEDQIILVEQRHTGLVAGGIWRIERQFGEETFARRIAAGNLLELQQIGLAGVGILMNALEMRLVPEARPCDI